ASPRVLVTLEDIQRKIKEGESKTLNLIIKADVQGSVEAIRQSLEKIDHPEVKVKFIGAAVGIVSDSDVQLASASSALIGAFNVPRAGGVIAGSYITGGKVARGANVRVKRGGKVVAEGKIDTLRREKDDAREVAQGYECGILVPGYDPQEGDIIECYEMKRIE